MAEDEIDEFDGISEEEATMALLGAFLGGGGEEISEKDLLITQTILQNKFKKEFDTKSLEETLYDYTTKFDEYSYDMIASIAANFVADEQNRLWYMLFLVCYAVSQARHSFFRAQFLIKTQDIFGMEKYSCDFEGLIAVAAQALNISEDEVTAFYEQMQLYAATKDEMQTRKQIAEHNFQHNIFVNYFEHKDNESVALMQKLSATDVLFDDIILNEQLIKAAENGVSFAQSMLGYRYFTGKGIAKDLSKAFDLLTAAAEKDDLFAFYPLGLIHEKADDLESAVMFYDRAAAAGNAYALYRLGLLYENGKGVEKNSHTAFYCYSQAKKLGNYDALFRYGIDFFEGKNGVTDKKLGKASIQQAANAGVTEAVEYLKTIDDKKSQKSPKPTPTETKKRVQPKQKSETTKSAKTIKMQTKSPKPWALKISLAEIQTLYKAEKEKNVGFIEHLFLAEENPKKLSGAMHYTRLSDGEKPILIYDDTVFGSAKDGFLLTDRAVYIHKAFADKSQKIPLEKVTSFELKIGIFGVGDMLLNDVPLAVTVVTGGDRKKFFTFLQQIIGISPQ